MAPRLSRAASALLCLTVLAFSSACEGIRPIRTLPNWVNSVYVPMARNDTFEVGLEEVLTRQIQQEFLADGRLGIVRKREADLEVRVTVLDYKTTVQSTDSDDIPDVSVIHIVTLVELYDPLDPSVAMATLERIETRFRYNSDPRSRFYSVEPDRKAAALERVAREVVELTITGFPTELGDLPDTVRASQSSP